MTAARSTGWAAAVAVFCLAATVPAFLQTDPSSARPQFEVASVKVNRSGEPPLRIDVQGTRFVATNIPVRQLIRAAYTLQLFQIAGAPGWADDERFDIAAVADRDITVMTPWNPGGEYALVQLMLQSLLAERFQLVVKNEIREMAIYRLVVDRPESGARDTLRLAAADCAPGCGMRVGPGILQARHVPLPQLAELLSRQTGRVVLDASGLTGNFDFDLRWNPDLQQSAADAPSIFTAVQEQLGLRLAAARGPVQMLVIERLERPKEN